MNGYTENLADFGYREQDEAKDIFEAWKLNGLPKDFDNDGVKLAFNMNSGYVFLTNAEYQVAMCGDNKELYSFYTLNFLKYDSVLLLLQKFLIEHDSLNKDLFQFLSLD